MNAEYQKWFSEIDRYLPVKKLFLLYGNIYDKIPYPTTTENLYEYLPLREVLKRFFTQKGYGVAGFFDIVDGLTVIKRENDKENRDVQKIDIQGALDIIRAAMSKSDVPSFFVMDYSSRICQRPDQLDEGESKVFLKILKCIQGAKAVATAGQIYNNVLFLICDKVNDIPAWLYLNNPEAKVLFIERPSFEDRKRYIAKNIHFFQGGKDINEEEKEKAINLTADLTDGMCIVEIASLRTISVKEGISVATTDGIVNEKGIRNIVDKYKYGVTESQWQKDLLIPKLRDAENIFRKRVKGQEQAVASVLDIIKRASMGLSGIQHSSSASKPRGILFFAGPTGVGKTELAKALAQVLFGDEKACIRFDMSEYSQGHADQRLLGAPPGYVGYEEGGQLTNKIREHPFSVLLFDEIEKAHPSILDKFLQILEDGRMTDGKGETVYFSEAIIIFTSNIGTYVDIAKGNGIVERKVNIHPISWRCTKCPVESWIDTTGQKPSMCGKCGSADLECIETPYSVLRERILSAINNKFKFEMGRPELLNRFGDNFVIFDYIRPLIMKQIIDKILDNIVSEVATKHGITITISDEVRQWLLNRVSEKIEDGGRGVGNEIEKTIVNPLARKLFDENVAKGQAFTVKSIQMKGDGGGGSYYALDVE